MNIGHFKFDKKADTYKGEPSCEPASRTLNGRIGGTGIAHVRVPYQAV